MQKNASNRFPDLLTLPHNSYLYKIIKYILLFRSSHRRCSVEKVFLGISKSSQEKTCARVSFLIRLQRCFSVNFLKFLRNPFLQSKSGRLFLTAIHMTKRVYERISLFRTSFFGCYQKVNTARL